MVIGGAKKFGLLLDYFFGSDKAVLSPSAAAGLSGLNAEAALSAMELLESEGILRSSRRGRRRLFRSDSRSRYYWRCRTAYAVRSRAMN